MTFRTEKSRALLAYLALEADRPHSRHTLAGLFWPDMPEARSQDNVRVTLHRLRKALNEAAVHASDQHLHITRHTVQFNLATARVDVAEFDALLTATATHLHPGLAACDTCLSQLEEAAALYRGELLAGMSLADAPGFEEWLAIRRELLHQKALVALRQLTDAYLTRGDAARAHDFAARQIQLDPYREEAHCQLMRALALRGMPDQAVAQFATLRQLLWDEMGVEPDAATVALLQSITSSAPSHVDLHADSPTGSPADSLPEAQVPLFAATASPDLSGVPRVDTFFGRTYELARLANWLTAEHCQIVLLLGIGGVGKTTLAAQVTTRVAASFDVVIWRSLLNAPPLSTLLPSLLQTLAAGQASELPKSIDEQMELLLVQLRRKRVLLVLDNLESILEASEAGHFRTGYAEYHQLMQRLAMHDHRSTLLLTSREQPRDFARWEIDTPRVRALPLEGLDQAAGRDLLTARGVGGAQIAEAALVARYSGNPLALKLVADTVTELFGGDISSFLAAETWVFDDIRTVLDQQMRRLTPLETEILLWLAVERKALNAHELRQNQVQPALGGHFIDALRSLQRRSLIEPQANGFALQNVVTEYLTARLIERACAEIDAEQLDTLERHALLKASADDDARQSQARLILSAIATQLQAALGRTALEAKLRRILAALHQAAPRRPSYAAGNLFNLLLHLEMDVTDYDFSQLSVWQADLRGAILNGVNFAGADLTGTAFTQDFGRIFAVALHPQGHLLAAGGIQSVLRVWTFPAGQPAGILTGHTNAVTSVAWSPDGSLLASGSLDRQVCIWDWQTGRCVTVLRGHTSSVYGIAFSPDGQLLASGGQDRTLRVWDVKTGRQCAWQEQEDTIQATAFHPAGGLLATAGTDHTISLWQLAPTAEGGTTEEGSGPNRDAAGGAYTLQRLAILRGHHHHVLAVAFSPDGTHLAAASADTTITLWHVAGQRLIATLRGHTHWVRALAFSADGARLFSGGADRTLRVWDVASRRTLEVLHAHEHTVRGIAVHPNGTQLASGGLDDAIRLWDLRREQHERAFRTILGSINAIRALNFSPDGTRLATGDSKGWVRLWSLPADGTPPAPPKTLHNQGTQVNDVIFGPDGTWLASADDDCIVRIWDVASGRITHLLRGHQAAVHRILFVPERKMLISAGYAGVIYLWDMQGPGQPRVLDILGAQGGHTQEINDMFVTPDSTHLVTGAADGTLRVWDLTTGECIQVVEASSGRCKRLVLDPVHGRVAAAGNSGSIGTYDLDAHHHLVPRNIILAHTTRITHLAFHPTGAYLVSSSESGAISVWNAQTGEHLARLHGHTQTVLALAFDPSGSTLASGSEDETVQLWRVTTSQVTTSQVTTSQAGPSQLDPAPIRVEAGQVLRVPGPYAGMNITGVTGISPAQRAALCALGAVDAG